MSETFAHHKKAPHNRCFGIEIECIMDKGSYPQGAVVDDVFFGNDGSVEPDNYRTETDVEMVTEPLGYAPIRRTIAKLKKYSWYVNDTCGIHVHVGRGICDPDKAERIASDLGRLNDAQMERLFGREPNEYCYNDGEVEEHAAIQDHPTYPTIEFRMFKSGNADWAAECIRRVRVMCAMSRPNVRLTYEALKQAFRIK